MPDQTPATPLLPAADGPVAGATLVIEAPTAEAALTQLHEQLGVDARIVEVRRVARGGIAGFFAREVVELHAAPASSSVAAPRAADTASAAASPAVAAAPAEASPIDRLLRLEDERDDTVDFATYLRSQLQDAPVASPVSGASAAPAPAAGAQHSTHQALLERATAAARLAVRSATGEHEAGGVVDPATDRVLAARPAESAASAPDGLRADLAEPAATAPDGLGADLAEPAATTEPGPAWSVANLVKVGLPIGLVRGLAVAEPADDVAWTAALAGALRPMCRPLPSGKSLLVGPRARAAATGLGVGVATSGQPIRSRAATLAVVVGHGVAGREWLARARGTRWLHLVVGGRGWRDLLHLDPLAVSWTRDEDAPEAIRLAAELGLVLGVGRLGRRMQRARPLDVALAVRELLPVSDGADESAGAGAGGRL